MKTLARAKVPRRATRSSRAAASAMLPFGLRGIYIYIYIYPIYQQTKLLTISQELT